MGQSPPSSEDQTLFGPQVKELGPQGGGSCQPLGTSSSKIRGCPCMSNFSPREPKAILVGNEPRRLTSQSCLLWAEQGSLGTFPTHLEQIPTARDTGSPLSPDFTSSWVNAGLSGAATLSLSSIHPPCDYHPISAITFMSPDWVPKGRHSWILPISLLAGCLS